MPANHWINISDIYSIIERHINLDAEDWLPQSPQSAIPKWKRNVRNVLQYRKKTNEIEWDERSNYRI
jgi:hypothetical protein